VDCAQYRILEASPILEVFAVHAQEQATDLCLTRYFEVAICDCTSLCRIIIISALRICPTIHGSEIANKLLNEARQSNDRHWERREFDRGTIANPTLVSKLQNRQRESQRSKITLLNGPHRI